MGTSEQIRDRVLELGHKAVAVTDHGSLFGYVPHTKAFKGTGVKVVYGVEAYIVDNIAVRERSQESLGVDGIPHITLLAKNGEGYENILRLNKIAWEDGFYYKPRIDHETLIRHSRGVIVLSGCPTGYPTRYIAQGKYEEAYNHMKWLSDNIEDYFIEIVPSPGYEPSRLSSDYLYSCANTLKRPVVLTSDAHFPRPEDHAAQDILLCIGIRKQLNDPLRTLRIADYYYYCSRDEILERAEKVFSSTPREWIEQAADNSSAIADMCEVEIPIAKSVAFPDVPTDSSPEKLLLEWVYEGWARRESMGQIPQAARGEYWERVTHEYTVLVNKGFADYILAISDVVSWMKKHDCLVVCRGSAGGSALLWLLGTSTIDPIKHELSFERFYDENRPDPPDVDIDFESGRRHEAIEYVFEKYGRDHCSQIASLSELKAKSALQDTAFVLGIPRHEFAALSNALNSSDDATAQLSSIKDPSVLRVLENHPDLRVFEKIIGQFRQSSVHAAGILISSIPIDKIIGTILGKDKFPVATVDKYGAADLGFLKMDFLGVNALDIISNVVKKIGKDVDWLESIPLDDEAALKLARDGKLASIFQLEGSSAAKVSGEINTNTFDDIVAASALCRPGPGDWVPTYRKFKNDLREFDYWLSTIDPRAAAIVDNTYGILLYQEQVMAIARELAGFSWPDVHKLRKNVTSSSGDEVMAQWKQKFFAGCEANGVKQDEAVHWWNSIQTHSHYSFNRAHCTTYGQVGYWMLYLKAHYHAQFYEAALKGEADDMVRKRLLREFMTLGGQVSLIDHRYSKANFSSVNDQWIVGGFMNLKGIGAKGAEKLESKSPFKTFEDMIDALPKVARNNFTSCYDSTGWKVQSLVSLVPWFPIPFVDPELEAIRNQYGLYSPKHLPPCEVQQEVRVCGYVTALEVEKDRAIFYVEDDSTSIIARVPSKKVHSMLDSIRPIAVGCYVMFVGRWVGDCMFINSTTVIKQVPIKENV